jgi:hypothetical protein
MLEQTQLWLFRTVILARDGCRVTLLLSDAGRIRELIQINWLDLFQPKVKKP